MLNTQCEIGVQVGPARKNLSASTATISWVDIDRKQMTSGR